MNEVKLNLGPYNYCADVIQEGCPAEYPCEFYSKPTEEARPVVCSSKDGVLSRIISSDEFITVPTFVVAMAISGDTPDNRLELIRAVELKILCMIHEMSTKLNVDILKLDNIVIPIKRVEFIESGARGTLRIVAEVGICVFEDSAAAVS